MSFMKIKLKIIHGYVFKNWSILNKLHISKIPEIYKGKVYVRA